MVAGLYALALLSYALWLGGSLPYHNDILVYVIPERTFNLECARQGLLPFWNPYLTCGIPHLANWQSAVFYPPYWLLGLTDLSRGLVYLALGHCAWAYAGFFLWARSQKIDGWICAAGALAFAGSAHFTRCWVNLPFVATASWIPWVFWSVEMALPSRRPADWVKALAALSLQLFAGYPIFVFYTWLAVVLWRLFQHPPALGRLTLLFVASLGVTSLQWLPFLEFLTFASHGDWKVFPYYTHPWEYLTLLDPTALGVPGAAGYRSHSTNALFGDLYFGLLPALLWLASLAWKGSRRGFWGFFSVGLLAWMAGPSLFLWKFIPPKGFDFLEPSKALGLFLFAACTAFCLFLGRFSPWDNRRKALATGLLLALGLADLLLLPFRLTYRVPDPYPDPALRQKVEAVEKAAGGGRFLALQTQPNLAVSGPRIDEALERDLSGTFVQNLLPNTNMVWGLRSANSYLSLATENVKNITRYFERGFPYTGGLLEVAGVKAFLLPQPLPKPKYTVVGKVGKNYLSVDPHACPDLRWVGGSVVYPDRPSLLEVLAKPGKEWRQKVYLEKKTDGNWVSLPPVDRPIFSGLIGINADFGFDHTSANQAWWRQELDFPPGFVVFNESYAPGWHAWVDGNPQPILRAYGLFMAVAVEKGPHTVDFRYEPASFRLGLFITLLFLAALVGSLGIKGKAP